MSENGLLGGAGELTLDYTDQYPALPDCEELEDDELNEETFGVDLGVGEEWDIDDLATQTAQISANTEMGKHHSASLNVSGDMWGQHQAWLEESISNLVDDDDDVPHRAPPSHALPIPQELKAPGGLPPTGQNLDQLFGVGSPQNPFLDIANMTTAIAHSAAAIWGPGGPSGAGSGGPSGTAGLRTDSVSTTSATTFRHDHEQNGASSVKEDSSRLLDVEFGSFTDVSTSGHSDLDQEVGAEPLKALLSQMRAKQEQNQDVVASPLKGAKTVEEIEKELRSPKAKVMSLEELERQILADAKPIPLKEQQQNRQLTEAQQLAVQQHLLRLHQQRLQHQHQQKQQQRISPSSFLAAVGVPPPSVSPTPPQTTTGTRVGAQAAAPPGFPQGLDPRMIPRFPAGHPMAGMPMLPPQALLPPRLAQTQQAPGVQAGATGGMPPIPPAVLMSPQFRAALAAHIAAGKPLPPGLNPAVAFQKVPPPPGFGFPAVPRGHQSLNQRPTDARPLVHGGGHLAQTSISHAGGGKMPTVAHATGGKFHGLGNIRKDGRDGRDPYNGIMGRKERDWLIKIQTMQWQTDNPYQDDYYFTMLKNRQLAKDRKDAGLEKEPVTQKDSGESAAAVPTPYVYVPPKFEGSLGKVQYLSANFPRQLIDLRRGDGSSEEGAHPSTSSVTPVTSHGEGDPIPPSADGRLAPEKTSLKQFKVLLMEVENLWKLLLDCEDFQRQLLAAPEDAKARIQFGVKVRVGHITERLSGERLALIACIRKGKHLIARSFGLLDRDQAVEVLRDLCRHMTQIVRKDMNEEALEIMFPAIFECMRRMGKGHLALVLEELSPSALKKAFASSNKVHLLLDFLCFILIYRIKRNENKTCGKRV